MSNPRQDRFALLAAMAIALVAASVLTLREPPVRVLGHLGPTPGPSSEGHISSKMAYLQELSEDSPDTESAALVSLSAYLPASVVEELLGGTRARAVFVRFPGTEGEALSVGTTLSHAVGARAADLASDLRAEIDALQARARTAGGAERGEIEAMMSQRRQALASLGEDCPCVYAVALDGVALRDLHGLQAQPEVRLVDVPDPLTESLAGWELQPIRPGPD